MKALQISNISKIIRWHWIRGLYRHISISGHKKRSTQNDNWRLLLQIRIKYCHWDDKLLLLFIVQTTCHSKYMRKWERSQCRLQPCPMSQMKANEFLIRWQFFMSRFWPLLLVVHRVFWVFVCVWVCKIAMMFPCNCTKL